MITAPQRILVPVDAGPESEAASAQATGLTAGLDAELVLLVVVSPPEADAANSVSHATDVAESTRSNSAPVSGRLVELDSRVAPGVRSRAVLGWGPAGPAIVDAARKEGADIVVMSMRRGAALSRLRQDEIDRYVLHHSDVPILVVPSWGEQPADPQTRQ